MAPKIKVQTIFLRTFSLELFWPSLGKFGQKSFAPISVQHGDAGDVVASPTLKNWPLFGKNFSRFGQSMQLHSHISEVVSIFPTKAK